MFRYIVNKYFHCKACVLRFLQLTPGKIRDEENILFAISMVHRKAHDRQFIQRVSSIVQINAGSRIMLLCLGIAIYS